MKQLPEILLLLLLPMMSFPQTRTISGTMLSKSTFKVYSTSGNYYIIDTAGLAWYSLCLQRDPDSCREAPCPCTITGPDGKFSFRFRRKPTDDYRFIRIKGSSREIFCPDIIPIPEQEDSLGNIYVNLDNSNIADSPIIYGQKVDPNAYTGKPAIYLYPKEPATISVKNDFKGTVLTTYPEYSNGWLVKAQPDGSLISLSDNRPYEYLFWDGICHFPPEHYNFKTGFVVKKEQTASFLLEKLALIGLNNKEINDFIIYWLPVLKQYPLNFIHFRINDDIDHSSILHVTPEPDSRIRLFMEYKPVSNGYTIPEQQLHSYPRKGFTLVEWGGAKIEETIHLQ